MIVRRPEPSTTGVENGLVCGNGVIRGEVEVDLLGCSVGPLRRDMLRRMLDHDHGESVSLQEVMCFRPGDRAPNKLCQNELSLSKSPASTTSDVRRKFMVLLIVIVALHQ